jgi:hypothetical protein
VFSDDSLSSEILTGARGEPLGWGNDLSAAFSRLSQGWEELEESGTGQAILNGQDEEDEGALLIWKILPMVVAAAAAAAAWR